ncbi:unnamed protein product, partial [Discosporangium mesarthrocarpum]
TYCHTSPSIPERNSFQTPTLPLNMQVRSAVRRMCASCYVVKKKGRVYVYCKRSVKHKQRQ